MPSLAVIFMTIPLFFFFLQLSTKERDAGVGRDKAHGKDNAMFAPSLAKTKAS